MEYTALAIAALIGWLAGGLALGVAPLILLSLYVEISRKWGRKYNTSPFGTGWCAIGTSVFGSVVMLVLNCVFYITGKLALNNILIGNGVFVEVSVVISLIGFGIGIYLRNEEIKSLLNIQTLLIVLLCPVWAALFFAWVWLYALPVAIDGRPIWSIIWDSVRKEVVLFFEEWRIGLKNRLENR